MNTGRTYRFSIDAFTPATLPMSRLAEYMADLATLLGEPERVHFERVEEGSVVLVQTIEEAAISKVNARLNATRSGDAPADALKAYASLDRRLAQDSAVATLTGEGGGEIIRFPGRERPSPLTYGSFRQHGSLDGVLVRIGGKDESVHATLDENGQTWRIETTRDMARELRSYLYEGPIRVHGEGRWRRTPEGNWNLERFVVSQFEPLQTFSWPDAVARLRAIEGSEWRDRADPLAELQGLRDGGTDPH